MSSFGSIPTTSIPRAARSRVKRPVPHPTSTAGSPGWTPASVHAPSRRARRDSPGGSGRSRSAVPLKRLRAASASAGHATLPPELVHGCDPAARQDAVHPLELRVLLEERRGVERRAAAGSPAGGERHPLRHRRVDDLGVDRAGRVERRLVRVGRLALPVGAQRAGAERAPRRGTCRRGRASKAFARCDVDPARGTPSSAASSARGARRRRCGCRSRSRPSRAGAPAGSRRGSSPTK